MKHLKPYKIFEAFDTKEIHQTLNDICLDVKDEGFSVQVSSDYLIIFKEDFGGNGIKSFLLSDIKDTISRVYNYLGDRVVDITYLPTYLPTGRVAPSQPWAKVEDENHLSMLYDCTLEVDAVRIVFQYKNVKNESKHLKPYKIFEAIAPTLRAANFMDMKEHIGDITQDLSDEGFITTVVLTSAANWGFVNEFTVSFHKPTTQPVTADIGEIYVSYFKWSDIKDRVAQIISSINEETNNEFVFEIQASSYDSFNKYWNSLDELDKNISRGGKILKELTKFKIRFINKALNKIHEVLETLTVDDAASNHREMLTPDFVYGVNDILLDMKDDGHPYKLEYYVGSSWQIVTNLKQDMIGHLIGSGVGSVLVGFPNMMPLPGVERYYEQVKEIMIRLFDYISEYPNIEYGVHHYNGRQVNLKWSHDVIGKFVDDSKSKGTIELCLYNKLDY